ncbi:hypothetical protein [Fulvivirga sedimenti]|uniref:Uncharacterized protein n=1 Tax=Fulvivirga sedimenti TaxID=2879465 RepID=A0A9X1HVJ1_9BACT|nr:hypothetical protein [Fulvivirga sedimenti]MCA6078446.1 hypothetical protein [Fulvivirga sedimenti]
MASLFSCGGNLSDQERKALQEEMANREIRQIRDEEIVNEALDMARSIRESDSDSLLTALGAEKSVYYARPENEKLAELWDAYEEAIGNGIQPEDNIQRDYPDWLIYTFIDEGDSGKYFMTSIRIAKKSVVLSLQPK